MEEAGGWFSANSCCPALPSLGPESSSEQLAALERKLRCLEQEKVELSRKLQGTGEPAGLGRVGLPRGLPLQDELLTCGCPPLQRLCRPPQTIGSWSSYGRKCRLCRTGCQVPPGTPSLSPLPSPWGLSCFPSTPESNLSSSPAPALYVLCDLREVS